MYDGCGKEILYRSSDQYGCCCFISDRKQQDQAERKKYRYSDEGDHDVSLPGSGTVVFFGGTGV